MNVAGTILVVDDDKLLREAIAFHLRRLGYEVIEASGADEALPMIEEEKPDMVITDVRMPHGDGIELIERLKLFDQYMPIVVFMTGYSDHSEEMLLEKGAAVVFQKPLDLERFDQFIKTTFSRSA